VEPLRLLKDGGRNRMRRTPPKTPSRSGHFAGPTGASGALGLWSNPFISRTPRCCRGRPASGLWSRRTSALPAKPRRTCSAVSRDLVSSKQNESLMRGGCLATAALCRRPSRSELRAQLSALGDDSRFFALLGSAPQELNTVRPEAKLT
jgi:hypothetical protein